MKPDCQTMPLPWSTTKKALVKMYLPDMPERQILREINIIIVANRNKPDASKIRYAQRVRHQELKEFVELHGLPKDYHLPSNF